jgi:ABC-type molybdenum transport system ATPase subunit/photorepair protein PhrA
LTNQPQLWLLVGGNGAGKSTFHRLAYPEAPEANSYAAARLADQQRDNLLLQGLSFC